MKSRGKRKNRRRVRTSASSLLGELVDEKGDADRVSSLGGYEEVIVVVDDEAEEHKGGHAGNHAEKGLHFGRLTLHPSDRRFDLPPRRRSPHL